jgi:hypothetical protein
VLEDGHFIVNAHDQNHSTRPAPPYFESEVPAYEREKILKTVRIAVGSLDTLGDSVAPSMESKVGRPIVRVNLKRMAELKTSDALFAKILFEEYRHVVAAVLLDIQENWGHTTIEPTNPSWVEYKREILGESKEST